MHVARETGKCLPVAAVHRPECRRIRTYTPSPRPCARVRDACTALAFFRASVYDLCTGVGTQLHLSNCGDQRETRLLGDDGEEERVGGLHALRDRDEDTSRVKFCVAEK